MTTINDKGELPIITFTGNGLQADMSEGRFISLSKGHAEEGGPVKWAVRAGRGESHISMALSDEAMVNLILMFQELDGRDDN